MKKILLILGAGVILFAGLPVPHQLRAHFEQTVTNKDANRTLRYRGTVAVQLPDRAKWVYTAPLKKSICLAHDRAWVVEPDLEQATLYRLGQAIPLLAILERAKKVAPGRYTAFYQGIRYEIEVDEEERLKRIAYEDDLGNRVVMRFDRIDSAPFDAGELVCEIPQDYDIIDGRY